MSGKDIESHGGSVMDETREVSATGVLFLLAAIRRLDRSIRLTDALERHKELETYWKDEESFQVPLSLLEQIYGLFRLPGAATVLVETPLRLAKPASEIPPEFSALIVLKDGRYALCEPRNAAKMAPEHCVILS